LVFSRDTAEEVLQNTNVVLCSKIHEFDGRASFLTWACTIARFEVLAARKRVLRDKLTTVDDTLLDHLSQLALSQAGQADDRIPLLRQCMKDLPEVQQKMIEERYRAGGSVASVAESLGRSSGSVRVTLFRSRQQLLECIEKKLAEAEMETP
jgi:RNA polymerase sigma-70 factor (ECF subfamily)